MKEPEMDKRHPSEPEVEQMGKFLKLFNNETERGAVLLAASILDEWLRDILKAFLIDDKASDELIDGFNAPLGTFSARAKAAYSLGLIEKKEYEEINIIRKIRNEFGHKWESISFESEVINKECKKLDWLGPNEPDIEKTSKETFGFTVAVLLADLLWRKRLIIKEKRKSKGWTNKARSSGA